MSDIIVLGTDTDAGKTTFSVLWLASFPEDFAYWKPIETGEPDSAKAARLAPRAVVHPPVQAFHHPVAPLLAARLEGRSVLTAAEIMERKPAGGTDLLIESFGSPLSPLNDQELQVEFLRGLGGNHVLVSSSKIGAIGRTLACLQALALHGIQPAAVVLIGPPDDFARDEIRFHGHLPVFSVQPPIRWDEAGVRDAARQQVEVLQEIRSRLAVTKVGPKQNLVERDRQWIWHPYTSLQDPDPPLPCSGAKDEFLYLEDGRRVIDGISSWWTILFAHRDPLLVKTLQETLGVIDHVQFAGVTHAHAVELAELLLGSLTANQPGSSAHWRGGRVFYSDNGSTAVEVALKMAYQFWCHRGEPGRTRFIGFEGGYHGDTFGAMAVGRNAVFFGTFEPLLFQADIVPLSAEALNQTLDRRKGEIAAVIVEPLVQGAGGMHMHSPEQLGQIAQVTRDHGVLLIADEVMTAGGRTGFLWAHQSAGIMPDLLCAAKTLAGGLLPVAATLAAGKIVDAWNSADPTRTFFHGHSFTGHPLACAVGAANWKRLTADPLTVPARMEAFWGDALAPLRMQPGVREVRVRGSIAAVELDVPGGYLAGVGRRLRQACLQKGVLLRPLGSVLYAMPPFCTSPASLQKIADAMIAAVKSLR
jgi:adenosylmethionine-8-amino-7-oxononanoate aminotransferase